MKPSLLIRASSSINLKTLGLVFPYCFNGVIVPTSTKPKPSLNNELYTSAFLSNPAELINKYGNLEKLLKSANEIKQNKRRETLIENKDKAIISKKLVTLKHDAPIDKDLSEFLLEEVDKDKLYKFLREMEFNRLLSSAISVYGEPNLEGIKDNPKLNENQKPINKKKYYLIRDPKEIDNWIKEAEEMGEVAVDTETSSLDPHQADLIGVSLSSIIGKACYIPIGHKSKKNIDKDIVLKKIKPLLEDPSIKKIGQNIKFDFIVLFKHGINISSMEDTMLMSYVLDAGKNRHNMDILSEIHLNHKTITFKDLVGTGKKEINFSEVDIEKAKDYAAEDADITLRLYKKFYKSLKDEKMVNIYEVFEKPMIKILAYMEIEGVKIDNQFLKVLSSKFEKKIEKIQKEVFKISKKEFNIASPKQLGEILYNDLKIADLKKTKKGSFATSASESTRDNLRNIQRYQKGGLSGKPIEKKSTKLISKFYKILNGRIKIIGVGGVDSGKGVYEKFLAGANYVQLYTGMIYRGPNIVNMIKKELKELLLKDGVKNFSEIIGKKE